MSILIKGMEMPQKGEYECTIRVWSDGTAMLYGNSELVEGGELVPVPKHGRLIDADALIDHLEFTMKHCIIEGHTAQRCSEMIVELSIAPTIIPADPAEEGE